MSVFFILSSFTFVNYFFLVKSCLSPGPLSVHLFGSAWFQAWSILPQVLSFIASEFYLPATCKTESSGPLILILLDCSSSCRCHQVPRGPSFVTKADFPSLTRYFFPVTQVFHKGYLECQTTRSWLQKWTHAITVLQKCSDILSSQHLDGHSRPE